LTGNQHRLCGCDYDLKTTDEQWSRFRNILL